MLNTCARTFVANTNYPHAVQVLSCIAEILCRAKQWRDAYEVFTTAKRLVQRNTHEGVTRPLEEALDRCVALGYREQDAMSVIPYPGDWTKEEHEEAAHACRPLKTG